MAKANLMVLPQTEITVDETTYTVNAMTATAALEAQMELMESGGVPSIKLIKKLVCGNVSVDNKDINDKSFDIIFARRTGHLYSLANEIIKWNMPDLFTESGTDEE